MGNIFQLIGSYIDELTKELDSAISGSMINEIKTVIIAYILMTVIIKGYLILAGKSQEPIKEIIFDGAIKAIIVTVITSPSWLNLVSNAINGLSQWAAGNIDIYKKMDALAYEALQLFNDLDNSGPVISHTDLHFFGWIAGSITLLFFGIFATIFIIAFIYSNVTLKIIIMLSPIMIGTLAFGWIKQVFSRWIELIISNTILVLLLGIILKLFYSKYYNIVHNARGHIPDSDIFYITLKIAIMSIILSWIVIMAKGIAQQLSSASIEHLPQSAAKELRDNFRKGKK